MKARIIKSIIRRKINSWIGSIDNPEVQDAICKSIVVTGGCIPSMLLGEPVNDYDVYFTNREAAYLIAEYYVEKFKENPPTKFKDSNSAVNIYVDNSGPDRIKIVVKSAGIASEEGASEYQYFEGLDDVQDVDAMEYVEQVMGGDVLNPEPPSKEDEPKKFRPVFLTSNAITLSDKLQIVIRFFGEPEQIHDTYDFAHCMCYWTSKDNKLVLPPKALESIITRELVYMGSKFPICSVIRTRKFIKKGWYINAGQYLKMLLQVSDLDLSKMDVLEEQLIGVDTAYFAQLLRLMAEKDSESVNKAYLMEIIDRMM